MNHYDKRLVHSELKRINDRPRLMMEMMASAINMAGSVSKLAHEMGYRRSYVVDWFNGKRVPSLKTETEILEWMQSKFERMELQ